MDVRSYSCNHLDKVIVAEYTSWEEVGLQSEDVVPQLTVLALKELPGTSEIGSHPEGQK